MVFLPHTNTVILLEPYCGTMTEPGLPVHGSDQVGSHSARSQPIYLTSLEKTVSSGRR